METLTDLINLIITPQSASPSKNHKYSALKIYKFIKKYYKIFCNKIKINLL